MKILIAVIIVIILILLILAALLLFVPVRVTARSRDHHYAWHWGKLMSGKFIPDMDDPKKSILKLKALFWKTQIHPFKKKGYKIRKNRTKKQSKRINRFLKKDRIKSRLFDILNTFKVETFRVNIDTDDYVLNGILFPVFQALSNDRRTLEINFNGIVDMEVNIRNHGWRLVYTFLR